MADSRRIATLEDLKTFLKEFFRGKEVEVYLSHPS